MPSIHKPLALLFLLASASFASPLSLGSSGESLDLDKGLSSDSKHPRNEPASSQDQKCQDVRSKFQQMSKCLNEVEERLDDIHATSGGAQKNRIQDGGSHDALKKLGGSALQADIANVFRGKEGGHAGQEGPHGDVAAKTNEIVHDIGLGGVGDKLCGVPADHDKGYTRPATEVHVQENA